MKYVVRETEEVKGREREGNIGVGMRLDSFQTIQGGDSRKRKEKGNLSSTLLELLVQSHRISWFQTQPDSKCRTREC